ncbi:hypothetical protein SAMN04488515_3541 [Cognatiyoonia koreensis]|uniref:Uncharacterized protein n=1 Tax=Cognatiyoonia koreensis TaxID=364200 RepID=A0A1I0RZT5_9RHOB|nr:hypothetical protein [Cognatiyoonia koreensis]SEW47174.1 hypothetical protein SAMN04488515_3541 [Cognatiyoonia koreensis]
MVFVRILMVVVLTLSASLSSAMSAGHTPVADHQHASVEVMADEQPMCCQDGMDRAQTCHALSALLPASELSDAAPAKGKDLFCTSGVLLTGFEPSGPLDPPRPV